MIPNTQSRLASLKAKSDFIVAMGRFLADKSGPIRPESVPERLGLRISYRDLSKADQRVLIGALARIGFERRGACWYRKGVDPQTEGGMIPREQWSRAVTEWLSTADSPARLSEIIRGAVGAKGHELSREDFSQLNQLCTVNGWKRLGERRNGEPERWYKLAEMEAS